LRSFIGELRPPGISEFGLGAALDGYIADLNRRRGPDTPVILVDLDDGAEDLPEATSITVFRIVQEALRNALRHASANEITVAISRLDGHMRLEICDDGRGFRLPDRINDLAEQGHFGLIGLLERVDHANGEIDIRSEAGSGTAVTVVMPVTGEEDESGEDDQRRLGRRPSVDPIGIA